MGWFLAEPPVRFLRIKPYWNCVCLPNVIIGVRTMTHLKLRQIGNSLGVVLPQEWLPLWVPFKVTCSRWFVLRTALN